MFHLNRFNCHIKCWNQRMFATITAVGSGQMGGILCKRFADKGHHVIMAGITESLEERNALAALKTIGKLEVATSLSSAVSTSKVIFTCLPNSDVVTSVYQQLLDEEPGLLNNIDFWLDATSGDPSKTVELANKLKKYKVDMVDCAVSGGPSGAENGLLTAMVGGSKDACNTAESFIETFASNIVYAGDAGAGHAVKCVNNALLASNLWVASEGLIALKKFGIKPSVALEAINISSGRSWATQNRLPDYVLTRNFDYGFYLGLLEKDHATCLNSIVHPTKSFAPILNLIHGYLKLSETHLSNPNADHVEIAKLIEQLSGEKLE